MSIQLKRCVVCRWWLEGWIRDPDAKSVTDNHSCLGSSEDPRCGYIWAISDIDDSYEDFLRETVTSGDT